MPILSPPALRSTQRMALLAAAFAISHLAIAQAPARSMKRHKTPYVERKLPGCDDIFSSAETLKHARLPSGGPELLVAMCPDYEGPTPSYIVDIRTTAKEPWLRASVPSDATAESFEFQFVDHTGDGVPELVVPIANSWGPFAPTAMYRIDLAARKLLKVESYPGESWPERTGTAGCFVTSWKYGFNANSASRYCWRDGSQAWELEQSCDPAAQQGCEKGLKH